MLTLAYITILPPNTIRVNHIFISMRSLHKVHSENAFLPDHVCPSVHLTGRFNSRTAGWILMKFEYPTSGDDKMTDAESLRQTFRCCDLVVKATRRMQYL